MANTYPYVDYSEIKAKLDYLSECTNVYDFDRVQTECEELLKTNYSVASVRALDILKAKGYDTYYVAQAIGSSASGLSRALAQTRTLPITVLPQLTYQFLGMSIHELLLNVEPVSLLPLTYNLLIPQYNKLNVMGKEQVSNYVNSLYRQSQFESNEFEQDIFLNIRQRLTEMANDKGCSVQMMIGKNASNNAKASMRNFMQNPNSKIRLGRLSFFALISGNSLDYFFVRDYTTYGTLKISNSNELIEDVETKKLIGKILTLPEEQQQEAISHIITTYCMSKKYTKTIS